MKLDNSSMDRRSALRGLVTVAGVAVTLPAMGSLAGCSTAPANLSDKMPVLNALVDRIIPATDTPGAKAAGVAEYVAAVFKKHFTTQQQSEFGAGLSEIANMLSDAGIQSVDAVKPERIDAVLMQLDSDGNATWQQLRDLTVFGFYTSELATQELAYEEIPGRYDGCVPLAEVGTAWLARGV